MAERLHEACFFSINVQLYSQNCIFEPLCGALRVSNINNLTERFIANKLCGRVLLREYQFLFVKQRSSVSEPPFRGLGGNGCYSSLSRWKARI